MPTAYYDAVHYLRSVTETQIYGQHDELLLQIIQAELSGMRVAGIWSDTIVPSAKDFFRWTKKVVQKSGIPEFLTSRAGDIALTALALVQPEIAVALKAGAEALVNRRAAGHEEDNSDQNQLIQGKGKL